MNPVLAQIDSKPWAIYPPTLNQLRAAAANPDASQIVPKAARMAADNSRPFNYTTISDNVAMINVSGVLYNPEGYIDDLIEFYFGGTSIPGLISDIDAVSNDSSIKSVIFNFHSPGGEVFGINEAADKISALSAKKDTTAYCYGLCCSAAYFLAAKCDSIVTDAQALLGSIGVVCAWYDLTGAYEQMGIAYEEVVSQNAPYKRLDIRNQDERAVFESEINGIEQVFLKSVATGRGVTLDTVKANFGRGAVMAGWQAVKAGLADSTGSLQTVIKGLAGKTKSTASALAEGEMEMGFKEFTDKFKKFAASIGDDPEPDTTEEETATEEEAAEETETTESTEAVHTIKAKIEIDTAEAEAKLTAMQDTLIDTQATAFVDAEVKAGRIFPAEATTFKSLYVQAAKDDAASPLESGSRVDTLKANQTARKPHGLTEELVDAEATQVLLADMGNRTDEEKKRELLGRSPLGKATLKMIEGGKSATATSAKN